MPSSQIAAVWPAENPNGFFAFALAGPIAIVLMNHYFPLGRGSLWMEWPQRLTDHFFGVGSALSFWRRLKPLSLLGSVALIQGCAGYFTAMNGAPPKGAVVLSAISICFGVGFFLAACLERFVLNANRSA